MIESKKAEWGNKIRVIAFSIDNDLAKLREAITAKGLTSFEHYSVKKNDENKILKYFRIKNIPYCALVDKQGKFAFLGHPKWRKLD